MNPFFRKLGWWTQRRRKDDELTEELDFHLEQEADARQAGGLAEDEARWAARRDLGNLTLVREETRRLWTWTLPEDLGRDLRHGLRALRRAPVFALAAILTLAIGIGANTAIFSVVNGVLLRPLAYPEPAQLIYLTTRGGSARGSQTSAMEYLEFRQFNRAFSNVGAFQLGEANLMAGDRPLRVRSAIVDVHLLHTLGVQPVVGRLFLEGETGGLRPALVAVLSYELWHSGFGGQSIVGRTVEVEGERLQVIGIMARGTDLMDSHVDIWLPLAFTEDARLSRNNHNFSLIGRLKEGIALAAAEADLNTLTESWAGRVGINPGPGHGGHVFQPLTLDQGHSLELTPLADQILGRAGRSIWVLQAAVALVLLIACANVANLLLARAETRRREFAVLAALGAGRGRLLRKAMTESLILSVTGGGLGLLLARPSLAALVRAYPASLPRIGEVALDPRVMLVALAVAVASGLVFGLAITLHTLSHVSAETLKSGSRGSAGTTRHRVRRVLVMAETALAVVVIIGAGLLLRTVQSLTTVDAGFDRSELVTFSITLPESKLDYLARVRAYQGILEQLRGAPGIQAASAMSKLPLDRQVRTNQTEITSSATSEPTVSTDYQRVMSGFFETMGIAMVQGRSFEPADVAPEKRVAIVNQAFASAYWRDLNPIGQELRPGGTKPWFRVIGVARDVKQTGVDQPVRPEVYVLVDQMTAPPTSGVAVSPTTMHVVIRTGLPPATLAPNITQVIRGIDPTIPIVRLRTMADVFTQSIQGPRLLAQLLTAFSLLSLLLAAIGTYGTLAYMVAERRPEIGIRMALGAGRSQVLWDIAREGFQLTAVGVVTGAGSAFLLNRLIAPLLFGVGPADLATFATAIPVIALVGGVACSLPAWRASRLDPNAALRAD